MCIRDSNYVNTQLAKKIAGDGEGATALFEVKIIGAESKDVYKRQEDSGQRIPPVLL